MRVDPKMILIVDDDDDIRELMAMVLEASGYRVAGAGSGRRAISYLHSHELPALVLVDLRMAEMTGDELVDSLHADPELRELPVVILSGDNSAPERAAAVGAQGCLKKPIDLDELLEAVGRYANLDAEAPSWSAT